MLKIIKDLQQNDNKLWLELNDRLSSNPATSGFWCRYTFGELRAMSTFCENYGMSLEVDVNKILDKHFNSLEQSIVKQIMGTTNKVKLETIDNNTKILTQRSQRAIHRLTLDIEFEWEQAAAKAAHQSKMFKEGDSAEQAYYKLKQIF